MIIIEYACSGCRFFCVEGNYCARHGRPQRADGFCDFFEPKEEM